MFSKKLQKICNKQKIGRRIWLFVPTADKKRRKILARVTHGLGKTSFPSKSDIVGMV